MTTKQISVSELKEGRFVVIDGIACVVKSIQISKPGKHGHTKCRIEAVGIINNEKKILIKPGHDNIETPIIEKESAQILSIAGDTANVMELKTFETFNLKIPEELKAEVKEGSQVIYWKILDDKVMKQLKS